MRIKVKFGLPYKINFKELEKAQTINTSKGKII